jgi:hypothetical protein
MAFLFDRESVAIEYLRSRISLSRRRMEDWGGLSGSGSDICPTAWCTGAIVRSNNPP